MPTSRYEPEMNGLTGLKKGDWAGWYEIVHEKDGRISASVFWWNGSEWNHGPNMRRGFKNLDHYKKVLGINQLVTA